MIQEFSVDNHLSFGDLQTISFEATSDKKGLEDLTIEVSPNTRLLKISFIYGPNGSGKTNILESINAMFIKLSFPENKKEDEVSGYVPFALRTGEPTYYSSIFWMDGVKYSYEIRYNSQIIISEKLHYYPQRVKSLFYERVTSEGRTEIKWGNSLKLLQAEKEAIKFNTFHNHTVLSSLRKIEVDNKPLNSLSDWIIRNFMLGNTREDPTNVASTSLDKEHIKFYVTKILQEADFNIVDYGVEKEKESLEPKDVIKFTHALSSGETFILEDYLESLGTIEFLQRARVLHNILANSQILLVDEIESHLHHDLVKYYLEIFLAGIGHSQLIATTHSILLLDEEFVRRDMVWFTEKSGETGMSRIYPLSDFGIHKNNSILKLYKAGRFGAKPTFGSRNIKIEPI